MEADYVRIPKDQYETMLAEIKALKADLYEKNRTDEKCGFCNSTARIVGIGTHGKGVCTDCYHRWNSYDPKEPHCDHSKLEPPVLCRLCLRGWFERFTRGS